MEGTTTTNTGIDWSWLIALLIIAGIFGNGFGFGGNNATASALTRAELDNEFTQRDIYNNTTSMLQGQNALNTEILNNRYNCSQNANATQMAIAQNRFDNQLGQANIEKDILLGNQTILANQSSCCCELKTAIHSEGEATRALIQENTIQALRDKIADKDREALATGLSYSTSLSVNNAKNDILNSIGTYYPKSGVNPYYVYQYPYYYGTTIQ